MNSIVSAANEGLEAVRVGLSNMEEQDLTYRMPDGFEGIFGEIATSMNTATDSLSDKINSVSKSAAVVEGVSSEVSRSTDSVTASSEQNAAAPEETAAALEQMSSTVGSMANSANDASVRINEINVTVGRLGKATQENAAAFFEVNSSMQGAQAESKLLSSTVANFKTMPPSLSGFEQEDPRSHVA